MVGVDADVDIAGVDAVMLWVRYRYEEGKDSEHQENESNGKDFQENPPILLADFGADAPSSSERSSSEWVPLLRPAVSGPAPIDSDFLPTRVPGGCARNYRTPARTPPGS